MDSYSDSASTRTAGAKAAITASHAGAYPAEEFQSRGGHDGGWVYLADTLLAALAFGLTIALWAANRDEIPQLGDGQRIIFLGVAIIANAALIWRRRLPVPVHLLIVACYAVTSFGPLGQGIVGLAVSLYSVGRYVADGRLSVLVMLLAVFVAAFDKYVLGAGQYASFTTLLLMVAVWYTGRRLRFRGEYLRFLKERAQYFEQRSKEAAHQAVAEERSRIARELHDIVAHQLSLMTVQAGAAKTVVRSDQEAALGAMEAVESAGRQALQEMRHLLHVLRRDEDSGELMPQPGCANLKTLVAEVGAAGLDVELCTSGDLSALPARVDLTVYRIVQEALTNVLKHSGDGVRAVVTIASATDGITVSITDNGQGAIGLPGNGYGIAGMRERAELLGGWLLAGEGPRGGFEVQAFLPYRGIDA
ncbi:sensor histidine kinase [Congregibacter variabilis]|uniref:histidine kinase n=1 Tax=Congregibacter variabilis TaxID=3081200 RepID=A0ABZ0I063_9GAMM|nr:sensor histidine kinase [Congregibacter sp. IMCC43200]